MRRKHALSVAAAAAVTTGLLAGAWPGFADEAPTTPTVTASFPDPPRKPIPTGPVETGTPTTADPSVTPPPFPPGGDIPCDPFDPDCEPEDGGDPGTPCPTPTPTTDVPLSPGLPVPPPTSTETPPTADPSVTPPPLPSLPPDDPEDL